MGLDIGIGDDTSTSLLQGEPSLWLTSNGYYWFLHPLFEDLYQETGEYIDLYGVAIFDGESLSSLEQVVLTARTRVESQPGSWDVYLGAQISPHHKELYEVVHREPFLALLATWEKVIVRAKELRRAVVCLGD